MEEIEDEGGLGDEDRRDPDAELQLSVLMVQCVHSDQRADGTADHRKDEQHRFGNAELVVDSFFLIDGEDQKRDQGDRQKIQYEKQFDRHRILLRFHRSHNE
jgi:hypothetical protein